MFELLSLESDKYCSFEETMTEDYGNQTMNWNTYSSQKNPLDSPQINVLEKIMLV